MFEQLPPFDPEAEASVLGSVLVDEEAMARVAGIVCEVVMVLCVDCRELVWDAVAIPVGEDGSFLCEACIERSLEL